MADGASVREQIVVSCFAVTWIDLAGVSFFLFYRGKDAGFKRKWFPRLVVLGGVLFVVFSTTISVLSTRSFEGLIVLALRRPSRC